MCAAAAGPAVHPAFARGHQPAGHFHDLSQQALDEPVHEGPHALQLVIHRRGQAAQADEVGHEAQGQRHQPRQHDSTLAAGPVCPRAMGTSPMDYSVQPNHFSNLVCRW
jgi:hypothetical protein